MSDTTLISCNIIWAAAVAAQRINGAYVKRHHSDTMYDPYNWGKLNPDNSNKLTNIALMRIFIKSGLTDVSEDDFEQGKIIRDYFCSLIHLVFSDDAGKFFRAAITAATFTEIPLGDKTLALIASLPNMYYARMEQESNERAYDELLEKSVPLSVLFPDQLTNKLRIKIAIMQPVVGCSCSFIKESDITATVTADNSQYSLVKFWANPHNWVIGGEYDICWFGNSQLDGKISRLLSVVQKGTL